MSETPIRISVTKLADFACRTGDLMPLGVDGPSSREGIRAHQKVQRQTLETARIEWVAGHEGENQIRTGGTKTQEVNDYGVRVEATLSCLCTVESLLVKLVGRVDIVDLNRWRLTEIKSTLVPAEHLPEGQRALQWAQLMLYGFIFLETDDGVTEKDNVPGSSSTVGIDSDSGSVGELELELLHVNIRAGTHTSDVRTLSRKTLSEHATQALMLYVKWLRCVSKRRELLKLSAAKLQFPHGRFRPGQRSMAAAVFRAARDGQELMCEAPTGIGKTISALFPAGKILGTNDVVQVIYLTAKVAGRLSAMQSLDQLQNGGLQLNGLQLRAKQATCFCLNGRCERDDNGRCPMTLGFFDRLSAARDELLTLGVIDGSQMDDVAWQHQLCPFELALQMLPWMHVVIADFNYVFDPLVRLPHFSESRLDTLLLIDEAHNLVDRSRSMFSAQLSRLQCQNEATACRQTHPSVARSLDRLAQALLTHANHLDEYEIVSEEATSGVARSASSCVESIVATMGVSPTLPDSNAELFRTLCRFIAINELFGDYHRCITRKSKVGRVTEVDMSLYCLDASEALKKQYRLFKSTVLFSATLRPILFYRDALGLPDETARLQLSSPFDPERSYHAIADWIDTRYRQREHSLASLISLISSVCERKPGSYLIFFPSYAYLNLAYDAYAKVSPHVDVWRQTHDQTKTEQHQQLDKLSDQGHRVGFAILGGVFGEGIDYVGNKLIGVVVISTGLPGLNTETRLVSEHYRRQGHDGFDFAYRYPGFTRVLQTVGRLIRTENDAGVVVLVDDRFKQPFYKGLFPQEWQVRYPDDEAGLSKDLKDFWKALPDQA